MNGRVYDPILGRFLSPDPFVQFPESTQGFNRYSYVGNNPLSFVDPSGYLFGSLGDFVAGAFNIGAGVYQVFTGIAALKESGPNPFSLLLIADGLNRIQAGLGQLDAAFSSSLVRGNNDIRSGANVGFGPLRSIVNMDLSAGTNARIPLEAAGGPDGRSILDQIRLGEFSGIPFGNIPGARNGITTIDGPQQENQNETRLTRRGVRLVDREAARNRISEQRSNELALEGLTVLASTFFPVARVVTYVGRSAVLGATRGGALPNQIGRVGEDLLQSRFGGQSRVVIETSQGRRVIDNLAEGVARESKVGRVSMSPRLRSQILKDAELLRTRQIDAAEFQFFRSPGTGKVGPTTSVERLLQECGIGCVINP